MSGARTRNKDRLSPAKVEARIIDALSSEPVATRRLAESLKLPPPLIYRRCRKLEEGGLLESHVEPGRRLLFCLTCKDVITKDNFDQCTTKGHQIVSFASKQRMWRLQLSP